MNFEGADLQARIKELIGEAVEARIVVRTPQIGSAIDLRRVDVELRHIERGEGDVATYGTPPVAIQMRHE